MPGKPLYPDIEWNKPEQRTRAGKLGIIGGNKLGFSAVGEAYGIALEAGLGTVRVILPDALKKAVPSSITNITYAHSNPSGSLGKDAKTEMCALADWADAILMIGDAGRNSETAILYEDFIRDFGGLLTITRDSFDLLINAMDALVEREKTLIVVSFAQLQKAFGRVYYPKILTFSMQLQQLVETLHKFTITYPITVMTFHQGHIVVANGGQVTTTPWENPMSIWRGSVATQASAYWLWNPSKPLQAVTASLIG